MPALRRLRLSTASVVPIIIINLIFTFSVPGISWAGHIGGFVTGLLLSFIFRSRQRRNSPPFYDPYQR